MESKELYYKCPNCGVIRHKLTKSVSFDKEVDGSMFSLIESYRADGFESFEETRHTRGANIVCLECGNAYADMVTERLYKDCVVSDKG